MREALQTEPRDASDVADASGVDTIRVALLHPEQTWVDALEMLLAPQPDIEVAAAHTDLDWIRHAVATGSVDLLLVKIDDRVGPSVIEALRTSSPGLGVVAVTDSEEASLLCKAVRAGVRGWVGKNTSAEHFVRAIRSVHQGEAWFPRAFISELVDSLLAAEHSNRQAWGALSSLSTRELEVLHCLTQGLTRREIAERFVLSPHTVRTHINNMLRKLDVHSTLAAVSLARQAGLDQRLYGQHLA